MSAQPLTFSLLQSAVAGDAVALRARTRLQPAGGPGDKVFPPTYNGGVYAEEVRRLDGQDLPCVLLDSVQSQANRHEVALEAACDEGAIELPRVAADLRGIDGYSHLAQVTTLGAPHRLADAILRDTQDDKGTPFRNTAPGKALSESHVRNATGLFQWCPHALLFGQWDSTGPKGGNQYKFARAMVSEIVAVNAKIGVRTSSRIDPLGIPLIKETIYEAKDRNAMWTLDPSEAKVKEAKDAKAGAGKQRDAADASGRGKASAAAEPKKYGDGKPSSINHGNVTPDIVNVRETHPSLKKGDALPGGVTMDYALATTVISLAALRRLAFPTPGAQAPAAHAAARTTLAAMGVLAAALLRRDGFYLRSRGQLVPEGPLEWEVLGDDGSVSGPYTIDSAGAIALFQQAVAAARAAGLPWAAGVHLFKPSADFQKLLVHAAARLAEGAPAGDQGDGTDGQDEA